MFKANLKNAVDLIGGQVALAKAIGVSQSHVWKWLNTTEKGISPEYVIPVAAATAWRVTPHNLRPDLYPHPDDGLPEHMRKAA